MKKIIILKEYLEEFEELALNAIKNKFKLISVDEYTLDSIKDIIKKEDLQTYVVDRVCTRGVFYANTLGLTSVWLCDSRRVSMPEEDKYYPKIIINSITEIENL